jgi:hypothetical protein
MAKAPRRAETAAEYDETASAPVELPPELVIDLDTPIEINGSTYTSPTLTPPNWRKYKIATSKLAGANGDVNFVTSLVQQCASLDITVVDSMPLWAIEEALSFSRLFRRGGSRLGRTPCCTNRTSWMGANGFR